jgi:predicted DNA-binding helix-hairpin-helix protein
MEKFIFKHRDLYYTYRRLRQFGIIIDRKKLLVSLTGEQFQQLKRKDKKKLDNLRNAGYNIQTSIV